MEDMSNPAKSGWRWPDYLNKMPNHLPASAPPKTPDPVIGWYVTGSSGSFNSDGWVWTKVSYQNRKWLDMADNSADVTRKIQFWQEVEEPKAAAVRR